MVGMRRAGECHCRPRMMSRADQAADRRDVPTRSHASRAGHAPEAQGGKVRRVIETSAVERQQPLLHE